MQSFKYLTILFCLFIITMTCMVDCRPKKMHKRKAAEQTEDDIQINTDLLKELQMLRMKENRIQRPFAQMRRNFVRRPMYGRYQQAPLGQYYLPRPYNYDDRVGVSPYPVFGGNDIF